MLTSANNIFSMSVCFLAKSSVAWMKKIEWWFCNWRKWCLSYKKSGLSKMIVSFTSFVTFTPRPPPYQIYILSREVKRVNLQKKLFGYGLLVKVRWMNGLWLIYIYRLSICIDMNRFANLFTFIISHTISFLLDHLF